MLAYKATEFENVSPPVWDESDQTSIDNIESMPLTLRQVLTALKNFFQKPDTAARETKEMLSAMPAGIDVIAVSRGNYIMIEVKSATNYDTTSVVGEIYPHIEESPSSGVYVFSSRCPTPISHANAWHTWGEGSLAGRRRRDQLLDSSLTTYSPASSTSALPMQEILTILDEGLEATDAPNFAEIPDKLCKWLGVTYDQLSDITDIGKTTFFDWKRVRRSPRPSTVENLLRVYALARAVINHFGSVEAATAWFHNGQTRPIDLLLKRKFNSVEKVAAALLFQPLEDRHSDRPGFAPEPDFDIDVPKPAENVRRATRGVRVVKLSQR